MLKFAGIAKEVIVIKKGFPPRPIELDLTRSLIDLGIKNKETLLIEEDTSKVVASQ